MNNTRYSLSPAFGDKLSFIKSLEFGQRRCLFGTLVVADSRDPRKAQGEARAVLRAALYFIVGDFDDDLGLHCNRITVVGELQLFEPGRHLSKFFIGQAFESFTYRRKATRAIGNGEMIIGKPAASSSRTAIGGCDHTIDGFRRFYLEPELASIAGHVGAIQGLGHQAFVPRSQRFLQKNFRLAFISRDLPQSEILPSGDRFKIRPALRISLVYQ